MGVSTDGEISFGVLFEEGFEFPWDDYDEVSWWTTVNGYEPPCQPFTDIGEYAEGFTKNDPRVREYFEHHREWLQANPLPFTTVNYCSAEYPAYILAIPGTVKTASRGYPEKFDLDSLKVPSDKIDAFVAFCKKYLDMEAPEMHWYLSSYWGC
jgi:hypothetical protein